LKTAFLFGIACAAVFAAAQVFAAEPVMRVKAKLTAFDGQVMTLEAQTIARACGKSHLHNLEPEDLVALTLEAAAMAKVPLVGTNWIPGSAGGI